MWIWHHSRSQTVLCKCILRLLATYLNIYFCHRNYCFEIVIWCRFSTWLSFIPIACYLRNEWNCSFYPRWNDYRTLKLLHIYASLYVCITSLSNLSIIKLWWIDFFHFLNHSPPDSGLCDLHDFGIKTCITLTTGSYENIVYFW